MDISCRASMTRQQNSECCSCVLCAATEVEMKSFKPGDLILEEGDLPNEALCAMSLVAALSSIQC